MTPVRVGIAGCGGVGLACAAWLANAGHAVSLWSPRAAAPAALRQGPLRAQGVLNGSWPVTVADDVQALCGDADVLLLAVPANGHRHVCDTLLPHLQPRHVLFISSMASLSALYVHEAAGRRSLTLPVASWGSTVLTARRVAPARVKLLTRRGSLGLSALPLARTEPLLALARSLFGDVFTLQPNALASTLSNMNPVVHGPLALLNWTRIERAEAWPQYQHLTPRVAAVIEQLDAERVALAHAFGLPVRSLAQHFAQSFGARAEGLAEIAAELHAARGGPPGPTDVQTRFLHEDMPYGLVFNLALARMAGLALPATQTVVDMASLLCQQDFRAGNDLIEPLGLDQETPAGLLQRVA